MNKNHRHWVFFLENSFFPFTPFLFFTFIPNFCSRRISHSSQFPRPFGLVGGLQCNAIGNCHPILIIIPFRIPNECFSEKSNEALQNQISLIIKTGRQISTIRTTTHYILLHNLLPLPKFIQVRMLCCNCLHSAW